MCVYPDPQQAMLEMVRVTRPGGLVLLLEHTRSQLPLLGAYQDMTASPVAALGKGCVWNQSVEGMVEQAGLQTVQLRKALGGTISAFITRVVKDN